MIEKLEKHIIGENTPGTVSLMVAPTAEQQVDKINELVDAVNALIEENNIHEKQVDELQMKLEPKKCEPADPYAEQRKWVGCLCWFWDDVYGLKTAGVLEEITTIEEDFHYAKKDTRTVWKHCEPVKPDDDIIYKGVKDE